MIYPHINSFLVSIFAETPISSTLCTLDDFAGVTSLFASATTQPFFGSCINGSRGQNLNVNNAFIIDNSSNINTISMQPLIDNGYLPKVLTDPSTSSGYKACIDTANGNQPIIFSANFEGTLTPSYVSIQQILTTSLNSLTSGVTPGMSYVCPVSTIYNLGSCIPTYSSNTFATTGSSPNGMAMDSLGNIYTSNQKDNNISKIHLEGL